MPTIFIPDDQGNVIPLSQKVETWTQLSTSAAGGGYRWVCGFALDVNRKLWVYGGASAPAAPPSGLWMWDAAIGGSWTQTTPSPAPAYYAHQSSVYDPIRDVTVHYQYPDDSTWEMSTSGVFTQKLGTDSSLGSGEKRGASWLVWDSHDNRVLLCGGDYHNDIWAYNPAGPSWSRLMDDFDDTGVGAAGGKGGWAWDTARNCLVKFGASYTYFGSQWNNRVYEWWPTGGWRNRTPGSGSPPATASCSLTYMPSQQACFLFGGERAYSGGGPSKDWFYKYVGPLTSDPGPGVWTDLNSVSKPASRYLHRAVYDPIGDRILMGFGGDGYPGGYPADVWQMKLT